MRFVELYKPYMLFKGMYVFSTFVIRDRILSFNCNYTKVGAKVKSKVNFALTPFMTLPNIGREKKTYDTISQLN